MKKNVHSIYFYIIDESSWIVNRVKNLWQGGKLKKFCCFIYIEFLSVFRNIRNINSLIAGLVNYHSKENFLFLLFLFLYFTDLIIKFKMYLNLLISNKN